MASPTDAFFDELSRRGHEPGLQRRTSTLRFDVSRGNSRDREIDHWMVAVDHGDIAVSRDDGPADCVISADQRLFDALVQGQTNSMAAMLRGALLADGDVELLVETRRLMPGPTASSAAPVAVLTGSKARRAS